MIPEGDILRVVCVSTTGSFSEIPFYKGLNYSVGMWCLGKVSQSNLAYSNDYKVLKTERLYRQNIKLDYQSKCHHRSTRVSPWFN